MGDGATRRNGSDSLKKTGGFWLSVTVEQDRKLKNHSCSTLSLKFLVTEPRQIWAAQSSVGC